MDLYHYSEKNGEFTGVTEAKRDPKNDERYLIPRNATETPAPQPGSNQAAVFSADAWALVPDYRGTTWYEADGTEHKITEVNQEPDPSWSSEKPEPQPEPVLVVSMRQARLALNAQGLLADVEAAIDGLTEPQKTQARIEWDYASSVHRDGAMTQLMIGVMGLSESDVDGLFNLAVTL